MEGNLNRARSTLNSRPSSSMSSFTNQSGDGSSMYVLRYNGRTERVGPASLKHRQGAYDAEDVRQGHARVFSETSVPSSFHTGLNHAREKNQGLGISSTDVNAAGRPLEPSRWFWKGLPGTTNLAARHNHWLEPLNENDQGEDSSAQQDVERVGLSDAHSLSDGNPRSRSAEGYSGDASPFDIESASAHGLTRSRSTAPLQDVLGQVQGLKDKISTLKEKARKDSFHRRSQNLRTPSPFTAADPPENWHRGVPLAGDRQTIDPDFQKSISRGSGEGDVKVEQVAQDDQDGYAEAQETERHDRLDADLHDQSSDNNDFLASSQPIQAVDPTVGVAIFEASPRGVGQTPPEVIARDFEAENLANLPEQPDFGDEDDDAEDIAAVAAHDSTEFAKENGSGSETLEDEDFEGDDDDFQEATLVLAEEKHEDRSDAFDYKHFLLLSGASELLKRNGSSSSSGGSETSSVSSVYSVETTKPATSTSTSGSNSNNVAKNTLTMHELVESSDHSSGSHVRKESADSISTAATFATATEGRESDDGDDVDDGGEEEAEEGESTPRNTIFVASTSASAQPLQVANSPLHLRGKGLSSRLRGPVVTQTQQPDTNMNMHMHTDTDNSSTPVLRPVIDTTHLPPSSSSLPPSFSVIGANLSTSPADTSPINGTVSLPATMPSLLTFLASMPPPPPPLPNPTLTHTHTTTTTTTASTTANVISGLEQQQVQQQQPQPSKPIKLADGDRDLAERLVRSLTQVCISLEAACASAIGGGHTSSSASKHEARVCRRRLDAARRVLDGEVNGEAF